MLAGVMNMNDDADAVHGLGHRKFVGGADRFWDLISALQFNFLVEHGLKPHHRFLDIACGSLRGGVRFIRYLDRGGYHGVDKHIELIIYGVAAELGLEEYAEKRPRFVVSNSFEFSRLEGPAPDYAIAQSLFTHLTETDIHLCLQRLRGACQPGLKLFATFFEVKEPVDNPEASHSHGGFLFTRAQMERLGERTGFTADYIGDWGHPRRQRMIIYTAA